VRGLFSIVRETGNSDAGGPPDLRIHEGTSGQLGCPRTARPREGRRVVNLRATILEELKQRLCVAETA